MSQGRGRLHGRGGPAAKEEPERGRVGVAVAELGFHGAARGGRGGRWGGRRRWQLAYVPPLSAPAASEPRARARPPFYSASRHAGPLAPHASRPFASDWLEPALGSAPGARVGREREGEGARTRLAAPPGVCDWCARAWSTRRSPAGRGLSLRGALREGERKGRMEKKGGREEGREGTLHGALCRGAAAAACAVMRCWMEPAPPHAGLALLRAAQRAGVVHSVT